MKTFSQELFEKYQKALGSAGMGLWEWNLDDQKIHWDIGLANLYRFPANTFECDPESWYRTIHPEDRDQIRKNVEAALEDKHDLNSLFRIILPDKTVRYIRTNGYKVKNDNGEVTSLVGLNWDVTHECTLQKDLEYTKSFLENLMNALPEPLFVKDRQYRWIFANAEFEKIVGVKKEKFYGKTDYNFFSKERANGYRRHDELVFKTGLPKENEEKVTDFFGETREILTKKSLFKLNQEEQPLVGVIRDITEKNNMDSRFRLMISLIDSSIDMFGFTDVTGIPLYVNKAGLDLFGINLGKGFFTDCLASPDKMRVDEIIRSTEKDFDRWEGEVSVINTKTKAEFPVLLKIFSVRMGDKPNDRFIGCSGINLTELKRIQKSLIEQSKMASLGEMAAEIAHEVNNPLMIIQAKAQMLQAKIIAENPEKEKIISDLQLIEKNSGRIDKIIKSLKTASRRSEHDPFDSVHLLNLVEEVLELSKQRFHLNEIKLTLRADECMHHSNIIYARSAEIIQVLVNLLNNSFDALKNAVDKWVEVSITCDDSYYYIEVKDSGPRIAPETVARMFNPFFTTKPSGQGTGLGLSVSKQIILNHGGEFYYNEKSKNTHFGFSLRKPEHIR